MLELILGILLAAGASYYVLGPILRPSLPAPLSDSGDEGDDPNDDLSAQAVALRALKEIEFDQATGKLSDADYAGLKAQYTEMALVAMRGAAGAPGAAAAAAPREPAAAAAPRARTCAVDGPRPESDAAFCSVCGRRLGTASGYCARCGSALETDARYCNSCGSRVAA